MLSIPQLCRAAAATVCAGLAMASAAQAEPVLKASIDVRKPHAEVTRYQYGMFIEPIGDLVARTLWAEMLGDRKFYFPVVVEAKDPPLPANPEGRVPMKQRRWRPLGDEAAVTMATDDPYVGDQDVSIRLSPSQLRGIGQSGIGLAKGRRYVGHVVLRGSADTAIQASLIWGDGAGQRQAVSLGKPDAQWRKLPFEFVAGGDAKDARFEITARGNGSLRVGVASLMPADNIDGWRADTTSALKELESGFWRLPGGNFLSNWDWHEAIGPRDRRPPMFDHAWSAMQPNDVGMDEYMALTRLIGVEPYVTVDAGLGDANSAAEEVEYLNGPATSEWGAKRAANGHPEPYGVRYWNIGNEPYGWWQIGRTTLDFFMIKHQRFAAAMRAVDPSIILIGSGAMPDQLRPREVKENPSLEGIQHKFGTEEDWTGGLLAKAWGTFDGISEHWYDRPEQRPDAPPADELIEYVRSPANHVRMKADIWAIYQKKFPAMREKGIFLSIDEYAYMAFGQTPDLKLALAYAMVLQEMLRHTDFLKMSALTTGVSTLDIEPGGATLNTIGQVFKLYGTHFGAGTIPLEVDGNAPQPAPKYPVGYDHPQVRSGSPTYPLDIVAGLSPDRRRLRIAVVNATLAPQTVAIELRGTVARGDGVAWRLTGKSLEAANKVGAEPGVTIEQTRVPALGKSLTVPPVSTSIFEYEVADT